MTTIGLLSDTHDILEPSVLAHVKNCDEVWHAGDFGTIAIADQLTRNFPPGPIGKHMLRGVYGNIDGIDVRSRYPEQLVFFCEKVKVMMRHIGGYPPKYNPETKKQLALHAPRLFICGHSHLLKIVYDEAIDCLHMNPGAAGRHGWQKIQTIIRFAIDGTDIKNCQVIELGPPLRD